MRHHLIISAITFYLVAIEAQDRAPGAIATTKRSIVTKIKEKVIPKVKEKVIPKVKEKLKDKKFRDKGLSGAKKAAKLGKKLPGWAIGLLVGVGLLAVAGGGFYYMKKRNSDSNEEEGGKEDEVE